MKTLPSTWCTHGHPISWKCAVCEIHVPCEKIGNVFVPSSKYWDDQSQEVYCGVVCSMNAHMRQIA